MVQIKRLAKVHSGHFDAARPTDLVWLASGARKPVSGLQRPAGRLATSGDAGLGRC